MENLYMPDLFIKYIKIDFQTWIELLYFVINFLFNFYIHHFCFMTKDPPYFLLATFLYY